MLAADIVRTAVAPNWTDIGQLAAIAVIRTFRRVFACSRTSGSAILIFARRRSRRLGRGCGGAARRDMALRRPEAVPVMKPFGGDWSRPSASSYPGAPAPGRRTTRRRASSSGFPVR